MLHKNLTAVVCVLGLLIGCSFGADDGPDVRTGHGIIDKVEKDSLTIRTREASGKFGKSAKLRLTGTSKISTVSTQQRAGKTVIVQRDTDAKDLQPKQGIAYIVTSSPSGMVLLAAVVQSEPEK